MWIDVTNNTIPDGNATGNGIDDDAIPLQKVFDFVTNKNAAATSPTGRDVIYFPPGRYRIGTTLVLEKGWGTRLVGAGNALGTELYLGGHARHAGAAVLFWTGDPGLSLLKVFGTFLGTIENLTFCGGAPQRYEFSDSTTNGDPGDGTLRFNATLTEIYIDLESLDSGDITWLLDSLDEGPAPRLTITNLDVSNSFRLFDVAAVHSETGYRRVAVNLVQEQGTFSDTNKVRLDFRRSAGSPQKFGFSTSTSGAPGTGKLAFNSTSLSSVTELRINELNLNDQDVSAWTATFDESLFKGITIRVVAPTQTGEITLRVTGPGTPQTGYHQIPVEVVQYDGEINDSDAELLLTLQRQEPIRDRAGALIEQKSIAGFPTGHALISKLWLHRRGERVAVGRHRGREQLRRQYAGALQL